MKLKILLICLIPVFGFGSPQIPELLIYKNDTIPIYNLIIEEYINQNKIDILGESEGQLFGLEFRGGSFNCWRGYQGIYKIENDSLFIVNMISIGFSEFSKTDSLIKDVFNNKYKNAKVFVDWFSGDIGLRDGDLLRWDGVFVKDFEKEKLISIKNGKVKSVSKVQNYIDLKNGISRKFDDKISDFIFRELEKTNWNNMKNYDCSENYEFTIGRNGTIKDVQMVQYKTKEEINKFWDKKEYNHCIKTIKNAVKNMQFDLIRIKGKNIEEIIWLEIWENEDGTIENWNY